MLPSCSLKALILQLNALKILESYAAVTRYLCLSIGNNNSVFHFLNPSILHKAVNFFSSLEWFMESQLRTVCFFFYLGYHIIRTGLYGDITCQDTCCQRVTRQTNTIVQGYESDSRFLYWILGTRQQWGPLPTSSHTAPLCQSLRVRENVNCIRILFETELMFSAARLDPATQQILAPKHNSTLVDALTLIFPTGTIPIDLTSR